MATEWETIRAFHASRQTLGEISRSALERKEDTEFSYVALSSAFNEQDYETSYFLADAFRFQFPDDSRRRDVLFLHGVSAFQTGRIDSAMTSLNAFLMEAPAHPFRSLALYWRARCSLEQHDWQSAESDFRQCAGDSATHAHEDDALLGLSLAFERRGAYEQAMETIQTLLTRYPQSDLANDAKLRLASLKLRRNDAQGALILLQETSTPYRYQREESLLLRAEGNFQLGNFDSARVRYERFLNDFPGSKHVRTARYGLAWTNLRLGNTRAAMDELDRLGTGTDTLAMTALYQNAVIALLANDTKDASARFDSLVQLYPYEPFSDNAYFEMGMLAYRTQRYRDARKQFQIAARLYPESELRFASYRMMGEACLALKDFSNAQHSFAQVRKLGAPDSLLAPSMFQEGVSLYHLGRFKSSAERFEEFLKKFPSHTLAGEGYVWKGEALYQDYRFEEAERAFSEALRTYPKNPKRQDAAYGVAWSLFEQKKFRRAIDAFDQFTRTYPQSERKIDASLRKADCYFFLGEYDKSEALYASLAAEKSDGRYSEYAAFQIAMSYIQRGDAQRGTEHLRAFLVRFPNSLYNEVVQFNIAWTFFSKEQFTEALLRSEEH
ncbi:MAG: tetratricopeptide repeat protein, partial [Bacteroidetes bacterium]